MHTHTINSYTEKCMHIVYMMLSVFSCVDEEEVRHSRDLKPNFHNFELKGT